MTDRVIPKAFRPKPINLFEFTMTQGRALPGRLGYMCNRKLKRRLCNRMHHSFYEVLADTGPGDLCLDLGANRGDFTKTMADTGAEVGVGEVGSCSLTARSTERVLPKLLLLPTLLLPVL